MKANLQFSSSMENIFSIEKTSKLKSNQEEKKTAKVNEKIDLNNVIDELMNNVDKSAIRIKCDDPKLVVKAQRKFEVRKISKRNNILEAIDTDFKKSSKYKGFEESFSMFTNVRLPNN